MITETEDKIAKLLEEDNLKLGYSFKFPQYRQLPDEVLLALKILEKHGMRIQMTLEPKK